MSDLKSKIVEKNYSWVSKKVTIEKSTIHGYGYYAKVNIEKGEKVFVKGGHIVKRGNFYTSSVINSYLPISDEYYIAAISPDEEENIKLYNNHSCNPNCGMHGEITFVAMRDIEAGEELTIDYAFVDNEDYAFECRCGSENCRGTITGFDWKIKELQDRYYQYFSQYTQLT